MAAICDALVRVALHDPDWRYAQAACLTFLCHRAAEVRGVACTCLGHVARVHKMLDRRLVEVALKQLLSDEVVRGQVTDALEDIETFLGTNR